MALPQSQWHLLPTDRCPQDWVAQVQAAAKLDIPPHQAAQLLWQRGIRHGEQLEAFLNPDAYVPAPPEAFGPEMELAVARLVQAVQQQERVTIWGDFDADGITATAVLRDGLGQFVAPDRLDSFIPNRLRESHGLSIQGLDRLAAQGTQLIVTCDNGSADIPQLDHARHLGIDVVVTDHHTLPPQRPPVVAILNPRSLAADHPLAHLSGVAVAYKLVEALYQALPTQRPLVELTDLVAIGLIADLVQLRGDCRYLAQIGIRQLQTHLKTAQPLRPGVAELLKLCRRSGDRPTDISFGLGPRINAVSRIHGDAGFCVELLTSQDEDRCHHLAQQTEWANLRRRALQKDIYNQVLGRIADLDLATTQAIVLADAQWPAGVLGIVAGQVAQAYGKPTILLTIDGDIARGSARSVNQIDLYQLVQGQAQLLTSFGGHPLAAGMTLPAANVQLLAAALNQQLRLMEIPAEPQLEIDLEVSVCDLGRPLFKQLNLLEPYGMGNPVPRLLVRNAWFDQAYHFNLKDPVSSGKLKFIQTRFLLKDETCSPGFPGVWWGHYRDELPVGTCDAVVELDFNAYSRKKQPQYGGYEIRLIAVRPAATPFRETELTVLDQRDRSGETAAGLVLERCPTSWQQLRPWFHQARQQQAPLVLAYETPSAASPTEVWQQLVGVAKYMARTAVTATKAQIMDQLSLGSASLEAGLSALEPLGFVTTALGEADGVAIAYAPEKAAPLEQQRRSIEAFLNALREEQFQQQYFAHVPVSVTQTILTERP